MSMEKMREEFEVWWLRENYEGSEDCRPLLSKESCGSYVFADPENSWKVWQASRAALVIDLYHEDEEKLCSFDHGIGYRKAKNIARQSIRAAGLKVTP